MAKDIGSLVRQHGVGALAERGLDKLLEELQLLGEVTLWDAACEPHHHLLEAG
jgi:hypothetical protein